MKIVKKENKYEKVTPLPKGWTSLILANRLKEVDNKYQKSYGQLARLLDNGYAFTSRESYRKNQAKKVKKKAKIWSQIQKKKLMMVVCPRKRMTM